MRCSWTVIVFLCCLDILCAPGAHGQTVGTLVHTSGSLDSGYVLFAPLMSKSIYLIDKCGRKIHEWKGMVPNNEEAYLQDDGSIVRATGNMVERIAWDGGILWRVMSPVVAASHHDIELLPNGNILVMCYDTHTVEDALSAGIVSDGLESVVTAETILELQPVGRDSAAVVWQWKAWDHFVQDRAPDKANFGSVSDHPELVDPNYQSGYRVDLFHFNSIRYNPELDQILVSAHNFNEIWIIDHSTSTAESKTHAGGRYGHGGDLLYRWGNPAAYGHGAASDQQLFGQHDARWIPGGFPHGGALLIFNNGIGRPAGQYSSVEIVVPPIDRSGNYDIATLPMLPAAPVWTYAAVPPTRLYSSNMGGAQMLSNGNVLISNGVQGEFWEIDPMAKLVWQYVNPITDTGAIMQGLVPAGNLLYKGSFYASSHPGVKRHDVVPGLPLESHPWDNGCVLNTDSTSSVTEGNALPTASLSLYPNPAGDVITISGQTMADDLTLYNMLGVAVKSVKKATSLRIGDIVPGLYILVARDRGAVFTKRISVVR